jgi:hypothetical protein
MYFENNLLNNNVGKAQNPPNRHSRVGGNLASKGIDSCLRRNDDLLLNSTLLRQSGKINNWHEIIQIKSTLI